MRTEREQAPSATGWRTAYDREAAPPAEGAPLVLDDSYRLCHLPLVRPDHPDVTAGKPGTDYRMGRYAMPRRSLVVRVPFATLDASPAFRRLLAACHAAPFAAKVAWDIVERRRDRLHATLGGGVGDAAPLAARLAQVAPLRVALMGPWLGRKNTGRIYLPLRVADGGTGGLRAIQRALGLAETGLYLVGLFNLVDHLTAAEADALRRLVGAERDTVIAETTIDALHIAETRDDLLLDGGFVARLPLAG